MQHLQDSEHIIERLGLLVSMEDEDEEKQKAKPAFRYPQLEIVTSPQKRSTTSNEMPDNDPDTPSKTKRSLREVLDEQQTKVKRESDFQEQLACTKLLRAEQERKRSTEGKQSSDANDDDKGKNEVEEREICLNDWWSAYTDLREFPHQDIEQLVEEPKSKLFRCLFHAEEFREEFGESAFPSEERWKRRKYEVAAGASEHLYKHRYDRKRVHDPRAAPRYNKRLKIEEQYEDCAHTWIGRCDYKPCGCIKCMPCARCGNFKPRCRSNA